MVYEVNRCDFRFRRIDPIAFEGMGGAIDIAALGIIADQSMVTFQPEFP